MAKKNIKKVITKSTKKNPIAAISISAASGGFAVLIGEFIWRRAARKALAAKEAARQQEQQKTDAVPEPTF